MSEVSRLDQMKQSGIVAAMRAKSAHNLLKAARAIKKGGVNCIEVAMTTPNALQVIKQVSQQMEGVLIGAGTVLDSETARSAILAGAEYLVSPTTNREMIEMANRYDKLVAPGAFTPTEVMNAWEAGADVVKVFPASRYGPKYISDLKAPLPQVSLMPTGGVNQDNAKNYIEQGADLLCVGSAIIDQEAIDQGRFEVLTQNARQLREAVDQARTNRRNN